MSTEPDTKQGLDAQDLRDLCAIAASICFGISTIVGTLAGTLPSWVNWLTLASAVAFLIVATPGVFRKH